MFFLLISMLLLKFLIFMLSFLSSISMLIFSFGGASSTILGNRLTEGTFSYSILTTQWFHVRVFFMSWDNASWRCSMACRNREFQWIFALCSYQTKIKHIPSDVKCKPSSCVFTCNTTSVHLKRQYCLLFSNIFCIYYVTCCLRTHTSCCLSMFQIQISH